MSHSAMRLTMPDGAKRSRPAHRKPSTTAGRIAPAVAGALLAAALSPLGAVPANAETAGMGPVDPANGFPTWYSDGTVRLQLCYEAGKGCLSEPPNPGQAVSYPDNFPDEAFWFAAMADVGTGSYEAALEAAHANEAVVDGDQMGFARLRFRFVSLQAGASYTITHPYGEDTLVADTAGEINETFDLGACAPTPDAACNWAGVGAAFLGDFGRGTTATFLRQDGAAPGTLGDINTARTVTGAPSGNNFVTITGPNAGGPGVNTATTNLFTVQGLIAEGTETGPSTPDLAAASDSGRSNADNVTRITTPTITGTLPAGVSGPVQLIVNNGAPTAATLTGSNYSATLAALPQGRNTVQARVANPAFAGDPTQPEFLTSATLTFTVDSVAPTASVVAPFPSSPSLDTTPSLSFTSNDANARFECQLQPTNVTWDPTCASPKTWDQQASGTYNFLVRATDVAGNVSALASRTVQIGTTVTAPYRKVQDFNSDGRADVISRDSTGTLWLYRGNGSGGFLPRTKMGAGWNGMTAIISAGDFNGDRKADVIARSSSGVLYLYRGNGSGGFLGGAPVGSGWNSFTAITAAGDVNGDRKADLVARDSSGRLFAYPGVGNGGFTTRIQIGSSWNGQNIILGTDFNGDAKPDIVSRDAAGSLWLYRGDGAGGFLARVQLGAGWGGLNTLTAPGDFSGDGRADIIARDSRGGLILYRGNGTTGILGQAVVGSGWSTMSSIQ
ncbi:VCBS repeat-containing protein [Arthrobacter sp. QXT-31]|uniref:VCBS repeat-containing protein n=1 Tax=Arthrobacter sp. QXT-31 TaxID=1357915 RepID=UPI0009FA105E|nr:VCBS repeat-containing protein [Arthrobacter sp. QXT-31]